MTQNILYKSGGRPPSESDAPRGASFQFPQFDGKFYAKLEGISTNAAMAIEVFLKNTSKTVAKCRYKRIETLPFFGESKINAIGLVGGGPSINEPEIQYALNKFYSVNKIIACGSSHDWLVEHGLPPNYSVVCDPDPVSANYLRKHSTFTKYLIASCCDEKVFEDLYEEDVYIWHNWSDEEGYVDKLNRIDPNFNFTIGGGCTVGLRSLSIALMMGYTQIHFFGFDSCLGKNDARYSYPLSTDDERMGRIYTIRLGSGPPTDKVFRCEGYHLAQAAHFKDFYREHYDKFTPVFHGEGLIKEFMDMVYKETTKLEITGVTE